MRCLYIAVLAFAIASGTYTAGAQSRNFELGKWVEIHAAILDELNKSYVDSLPIDKIERRGVDAMLAGLDPYTVYIPAEENENLQMMIHKSYGGIGAVIYKPDINGNVIINEPYAGSPAHKYGLRCGDEIISINGESVKGLTSQQCSDKMRGDPNTEVVFQVKKVRSCDTTEVRVTRERIKLPDIEYAGMLDGETGYILQSGFSDGVGLEMRDAVSRLLEQGMKTLVLDLRGNGGGLMDEAGEIVSIFLPKGSIVVSSMGKDKNSSYTLRTRRAPLDMNLELVVLVDGSSASASEIVAGAIQDTDRGTIMGERTFGKGLVQSIRPLPYGGEMKVTTAKYYTPSGRCVQAIDYAHRREDGSVSHIPDSLTSEFRTAHGRVVRDGGGITPDVTLKSKEYSRITYSLVAYGVIEEFVLDYVRRHESIAPVEEFSLGDEEFDKFVEFAKGKEFDYRSSAKTLFDSMKSELDKDGLTETLASQLNSLEEAINMEKEDFLRLKKDEIIPFIEEEIVVRYYFQEAGIQLRLRYDDTLREALASPRIAKY